MTERLIILSLAFGFAACVSYGLAHGIITMTEIRLALMSWIACIAAGWFMGWLTVWFVENILLRILSKRDSEDKPEEERQ